jgi:hypothetical protein
MPRRVDRHRGAGPSIPSILILKLPHRATAPHASDAMDGDSFAPPSIHCAVETGSVDEVRKALAAEGYPISVCLGRKDELLGVTALHVAAEAGDVRMIEVGAGGDIWTLGGGGGSAGATTHPLAVPWGLGVCARDACDESAAPPSWLLAALRDGR